MKKRVILGISGGVDSSVAALLLKKRGYDVIAIFMKNWDDDLCTSSKDYEDASSVCFKLDIPIHTVSFAKEYKEKVFNHFLREYKIGNTPNPDILCNTEIKFKLFFEKAKRLGADFIATGHYAKKKVIDKKSRLFKAKDLKKDQSYFLYTLKSEMLDDIIFPLEDLEKKEVRNIAKKYNLPNHNKKDSTGICFIGKKDFRPFLGKYLGYKKGPIKDMGGKVLGEHLGAHLFTIGQRKGLNIGGAEKPYFVASKDVKTNTLYVVSGEDNPLLYSKSLIAKDMSWVFKEPKKRGVKAKIRYRQSDQDCIIERSENGKIFIEFEKPQKAPAPSQSVVFYDGDECLGGGIIESVGDSKK